jgi:hypothetical protein
MPSDTPDDANSAGVPSKMMRCRRTTTRSITSATADNSWDTSSTPAPCARCRCSSESRNRRCDARSTPAIGSSRTSSAGSLANARAMNARCCCPTDSSFRGCCASSASPTDSIACMIAPVSDTLGRRHQPRCRSRPDDTISNTVAGTSLSSVGRCGT